jgi:hypothetical protein
MISGLSVLKVLLLMKSLRNPLRCQLKIRCQWMKSMLSVFKGLKWLMKPLRKNNGNKNSETLVVSLTICLNTI